MVFLNYHFEEDLDYFSLVQGSNSFYSFSASSKTHYQVNDDDVASNSDAQSSLELGVETNGTLDYIGDRDWFKLIVESSGLLDVELIGETVEDTYLRIYDSQGELVFENDDYGDSLDSSLTFQVEAGEYFVSAASYDDSYEGNYVLSARVLDVSDDVAGNSDTQSSLELGVETNGTLDYVGDRDWFKLIVESSGLLDVELIGETVEDTYLRIYDSQGELVFANDDYGDSLDSSLTFQAEAGEYFVSAASYDDSYEGNYVLSARVLDVSDDVAGNSDTQSSLELGVETNGTLDYVGDRDWFKLIVESSGLLDVELIGETVEDTYLRIYDSQGELVFENDDYGDSLDSSLTFQAEAGEYFVSAASYDDSYEGSYVLSARVLDVSDDVAGNSDTQSSLELGVETNGTLDYVGDRDWFKLIVESSGLLDVELIGETVEDTYLRIYDSQGELVFENDDYGDSLDSSLTFQAEAGEYFVSAASYDDSYEGSYVLSARVLDVSDDVAGNSDTQSSLELGVETNGTLDYVGDRDWFKLIVESSGLLDVELIGETVEDTYLRIYDSQGELVFENDDYGDSLDSSLTFQAEAGEYFVSAASYDDSLIGTYSLSAEFVGDPVIGEPITIDNEENCSHSVCICDPLSLNISASLASESAAADIFWIWDDPRLRSLPSQASSTDADW